MIVNSEAACKAVFSLVMRLSGASASEAELTSGDRLDTLHEQLIVSNFKNRFLLKQLFKVLKRSHISPDCFAIEDHRFSNQCFALKKIGTFRKLSSSLRNSG